MRLTSVTFSYLELALDGPIQGEVRDNLVRSHAASKSLIHVINDLLVSHLAIHRRWSFKAHPWFECRISPGRNAATSSS